MIRHSALLALLPLLLLAACGKPADEGDVKPVASVTTAIVQTGDADDTLTAYGAAEFAPGGEHGLVAPVEAVVARILAPTGTRVAAGQAIAVLQPSPASALDLSKALADATAADAALARAVRLKAGGLSGDAEVETARAAAETADAMIKSLTARGGAALTLKAPTAGVVESFGVDTGAVAPQGATVVKIGDLGALRLRLGVEPGRVSGVRIGAVAHLASLAGRPGADGSVTAIDPRLDPQTRQASVYLVAPGGAFAPGEPVKADIVLARHARALLIPRAAVLYDGPQPYVFVAAGGAAHRRNIALGVETAAAAEAAKGLSAGERVVAEGASALEDGMAIREAAPATAAPP